ncbi:hypothetical protein [Nocardia sp. NPDC050793]|uniref:hypothetical protein n=1 Tax=Nocardia sp. NPDC050793 TaxID=3155159 RepID=UPI0033CB2B77
MKAALLAALAMPFLLAPAVALADPDAPPPIFNQDEKCAATQGFVDKVREQQPEATPEQIADAYIAVLDSRGAYRGIEHVRDRDRQTFLDLMAACRL